MRRAWEPLPRRPAWRLQPLQVFAFPHRSALCRLPSSLRGPLWAPIWSGHSSNAPIGGRRATNWPNPPCGCAVFSGLLLKVWGSFWQLRSICAAGLHPLIPRIRRGAPGPAGVQHQATPMRRCVQARLLPLFWGRGFVHQPFHSEEPTANTRSKVPPPRVHRLSDSNLLSGLAQC